MSLLTVAVKNNPLRQKPDAMAVGLGWFSIGLGLFELLAPAAVERRSGLRTNRLLTRLFGAREIATGIGLLGAQDRGPWLSARLAGDALDLSSMMMRRRAGAGANTALAFAAVAGVALLDAAVLIAIRNKAQHDSAERWDYSDRVGIRRT